MFEHFTVAEELAGQSRYPEAIDFVERGLETDPANEFNYLRSRYEILDTAADGAIVIVRKRSQDDT